MFIVIYYLSIIDIIYNRHYINVSILKRVLDLNIC